MQLFFKKNHFGIQNIQFLTFFDVMFKKNVFFAEKEIE